MNGSSVIDGRLWGKSFFKLLEQQLILMVVLLEPVLSCMAQLAHKATDLPPAKTITHMPHLLSALHTAQRWNLPVFCPVSH